MMTNRNRQDKIDALFVKLLKSIEAYCDEVVDAYEYHVAPDLKMDKNYIDLLKVSLAMFDFSDTDIEAALKCTRDYIDACVNNKKYDLYYNLIGLYRNY